MTNSLPRHVFLFEVNTGRGEGGCIFAIVNNTQFLLFVLKISENICYDSVFSAYKMAICCKKKLLKTSQIAGGMSNARTQKRLLPTTNKHKFICTPIPSDCDY